MAGMGSVEYMSFWSSRRVLITGHPGSKVSWLSQWLLNLGAEVAGFALPAQSDRPLFNQLGLSARMDHATGDIGDPNVLIERVKDVVPEAPHEAGLISLGIEAARHDLGYALRWDSKTAIACSIEWYCEVLDGADAGEITHTQIVEFGAP